MRRLSRCCPDHMCSSKWTKADVIQEVVMNLLLMRAGFPPLRIQPEHRAAYFTALDECRFESPKAYVEWIAAQAEAELDFWLGALAS